jgi:hypothetical protein
MRSHGVVLEAELGKKARERFATVDFDAIEFLFEGAEEALDAAVLPRTARNSELLAGQTTVAASFTFIAAQTGLPVTITKSTVLTVKQPVQLVLTATSTNLIVGQSSTVTVKTSDPAPAGGLVVSLSGGGTGAGTYPTPKVIFFQAPTRRTRRSAGPTTAPIA